MRKKIEKIFFHSLIKILWPFNMKLATKMQYIFLKRNGVVFASEPRYISAKVWFDGTDYSLIKIGKRVTISSNVRILTHDWSLDTVHEAFFKCDPKDRPLGQIREVVIGDYSFIGTGSIIMPGAKIGKGVIVGAGTVVRGNIPDYSIIIGNPCKIIGDSREYCKRKLEEKNIKYEVLK
jgi:acetyltransferase-like isoleucine patch superfamily enzyme